MGFIESVNKIGKKIDITKTSIYKDIMDHRKIFLNKGMDIKIKDEFDLFRYEVIDRSLMNFVHIENHIEIFLNMNLDILNIVNYVEKQRLFDHDASIFLNNIRCFYDYQSDTMIYIPIFEPYINHKYIHEYQAILLKRYRNIVNAKDLHIDSAFDLYGYYLYRTDFTSLKISYEDFRHICMYSDELKTIYIFDKNKKILLNKMIVADHSFNGEIDFNDIKIISQLLEDYHYQECLDYMYDKHYISILSYNSINKRLD